MAGADYRPEGGDMVIGAALGVGQTRWNTGSGLGTGYSSTTQFGLFASKRFNDLYASVSAGYAQFVASTARNLSFGGANRYAAHFRAQDFGERLEIGRRFVTADALGVSPYVMLENQNFEAPGYTETTVSGSPLFALSYVRRTQTSLSHEIGVQFDQSITGEQDVIGLHARLGWDHNYAGGLRDLASFSAFSGSSFTVYGASPAKDAARLSLGAEAELENGITLSGNVRSQLGQSSQTYDGFLSMAYRW